MRTGRTGGAAIAWVVALVLYAISLNTTWFTLDGQQFHVRPLVGAGVVGSATFVFYLFAMIMLFGLAAVASAVVGPIHFSIRRCQVRPLSS
jgi:hypothetical protein